MKKVTLELTNRCNLRCSHCFNSAGEKKVPEMSTGEVFRLIDCCWDQGVRFISFGGGEVFVRRDIFDILDYAADRGLPFGISTNGTSKRALQMEKLSRAGPEIIQVSLDGPRELHDRIRTKPGSFDRVVQYLTAVDEAALAFCIQFTFGPEGVMSIPWVLEFCCRFNNIREVKVTPLLQIGRGAQRRALDYEDSSKAYDLISESKRVLRPEYSISTELCGAGVVARERSRFRRNATEFLIRVIKPDGSLHPWFGLPECWGVTETRGRCIDFCDRNSVVKLSIVAIAKGFERAERALRSHRIVDLSASLHKGFMDCAPWFGNRGYRKFLDKTCAYDDVR